ncbi:MAG: glycosyltransferase family 4 protein [Desulfovibrio sp.]|nr:glycosyltransferase family 4 protein [Desulfovibrio sp.]
MKTLCIDTISLLGEETGVGRYTRQIAQAVRESRLFRPCFTPCDPAQSKSTGPGFLDRCKTSLADYPPLFRLAKLVFTACRWGFSRVSRQVYDCYFEPNFILNTSVRARKAVMTVHDLSCFLFPQWHPAERVRHMERHFHASLDRADAIITVSEAIRKELISFYGVAETRVVTIHNGVDHEVFRPVPLQVCQSVRQTFDLPEHFVLHVGTLEPRKNLQTLLQAHAALPEKLRQLCPLLLAGASGWNNKSLQDAVRLNDHVRWLGYVQDGDLAVLYNLADVMVYPSWYEGFGLPVAEAMACGCPVLASSDPALVETAGGAARHVPPGDVETMSACLKEMLEDVNLRQSMRQEGLNRSARFTWAESGRRHLELFSKLCANL